MAGPAELHAGRQGDLLSQQNRIQELPVQDRARRPERTPAGQQPVDGDQQLAEQRRNRDRHACERHGADEDRRFQRRLYGSRHHGRKAGLYRDQQGDRHRQQRGAHGAGLHDHGTELHRHRDPEGTERAQPADSRGARELSAGADDAGRLQRGGRDARDSDAVYRRGDAGKLRREDPDQSERRQHHGGLELEERAERDSGSVERHSEGNRRAADPGQPGRVPDRQPGRNAKL